MPFSEDQYKQYIEHAKSSDSYDEFKDKAQKSILPDNPRVCKVHKDQGHKDPLSDCPKCNQYHPDMITGTSSNLDRCGYLHIDSRNNTVSIPEHSKKYLGDEITFSNLTETAILDAWDSSKYKDADQFLVEGVLDVLDKLPKKGEDPISQVELEERLSEDTNPINGYDFNEASGGSKRTLRELLKILVSIGVVKSFEGGKHRLVEQNIVNKFKKKLQKICVLNIAEDTINILGPDHEILTTNFIMAVSKYYVYRITRGIGKQRALTANILKELEKVHQDLAKEYQKEGRKWNFSAKKGTTLKRTATLYRKKLAQSIASKCGITDFQDDSTYNKIKGVSISSLKRLEECQTLDELKTSLKRVSGTRFDRSILDEIKHNDGDFIFSKDFKFFSEADTPWQIEAVKKWKRVEEGREEYTGIVSAVTGSGKTIMAMLAIEEFVSKNPNTVVSIIVPTKVLMYQWGTEIARLLGVGSKEIGLRGDGFKDRFVDGKRVVVSIVNSAIKNAHLEKDIGELPGDVNHLLIADECHRYGGDEFNKVFNARIDAKLGLSATPPGENYEGDETEEKIGMGAIVADLGKIFYRLTYKKARENNLICEFTIKYVGVNLSPENRTLYENLTKAIAKQIEKIMQRYGHRLDAMKADSLHQKLQSIIKTDDYPDSSIFKFFELTKQRRDIVDDAFERMSCYQYIESKALKEDKKIMVFHEKISQLERIVSRDRRTGSKTDYLSKELQKDLNKKERPILDELEKKLDKKYYRPVMYHSKQDPKWNRWGMNWFKADKANVMLSVKALVEGVDVPAANVGIVRVSSGSVRQRIQTIGRILRREKDTSAEIWVLFVKNTVDENIFRAYDWEEELGMSALEYWEWEEKDEDYDPLVKMDKLNFPEIPDYESEKAPLEVDVSSLKPGDPYPGRYAGDMFHVTADGKPYQRTRLGRAMIDHTDAIDVGKQIRQLKGGGKFLITGQGHAITQVKGQGIVYLGTLDLDAIKAELKEKRQELEKEKKKSSKKMKWEDLFA